MADCLSGESSFGTTGPTLGRTVAAMLTAYRTGRTTPAEVVQEVHDQIVARGDDGVWITLTPIDELRDRAEELMAQPDDLHLPLFGIPFGVKDSIHVAGWPTTLACPDYSTVAAETAPVIGRLLAAGAILVGKTNLDQFATGLNGTRTAYPIPRSVYGGDLISGGSSSGSALAVALGEVPFTVATDTAGSGRVPPALNGVVGFKPSRGLISTVGLVPACRSLDCVSLIAGTVADLARVFDVVAHPDLCDPWHRERPYRTKNTQPPITAPEPPSRGPEPAATGPEPATTGLEPAPTALEPAPTASEPVDDDTFDVASVRVGLPDFAQLEFFADVRMAEAHGVARAQICDRFATIVTPPLAPFLDAGALLYAGPWVAERLVEFGAFMDAHPGSTLPVVETIIRGGGRFTAVDVFTAQYRLAELKSQVAELWQTMDVLILPTVGTTFTVAQVLAEPITTNTTLGHYTHFGNLLDLCAVALPAGVTADGRPASTMVLGPALADDLVLAVAGRIAAEASPTSISDLVRPTSLRAVSTSGPVST